MYLNTKSKYLHILWLCSDSHLDIIDSNEGNSLVAYFITHTWFI